MWIIINYHENSIILFDMDMLHKMGLYVSLKGLIVAK